MNASRRPFALNRQRYHSSSRFSLGNHYVEYLTVPEEDDDPDFVAEETDDETEISTFEDPEEIDESELKVRVKLVLIGCRWVR